ncbi:MAG: prepilin-type N-terminal cleavage/methylation domain-containing protein [Kiritimatiellae bacterium]|nr:prepilin-type N-terminal cleavage/methylation domain-containing protein [Kiritimatiellia bacterium]
MSIARTRKSETPPRLAAGGFTLIELLVAMALMVIALGITFSTFYSISKAWQRGQGMADSLNRGEFVMEQVVDGLRSAFFPVRQPSQDQAAGVQTNATNTSATGAAAAVSSSSDYGFMLEDDGEGAEARDAIGWVKTGIALLGNENPLWRGLHRVRISVEEDEDGRLALASRAWRPYGNAVDFAPEEVAPFFISEKILGMNCRVAREPDDDEGWKWEDEWEGMERTNRLPLAVEIVLYLAPPEKNGETVEIRRVVEIPVAPLSWSAGKTK